MATTHAGLRVGVMSMHRILNYGSTLQAYGLRQLIQGLAPDLGVSFIDYRPGPTVGSPSARRSPIASTLGKLRAYNDVDAKLADRLRFMNFKRTYAQRYWSAVGIDRAEHHGTAVDVQVIGSDEVFNCLQHNPRVGYSRDLFGHASEARKIISYAASFGNTTLAKLEAAGLAREVADDLSRFATISVRDANSARIVHELTGVEPLIHVDPVLAYDFAASGLDLSERPLPEKYIVAYGYSGRFRPEENRAVRAHARAVDARVICLGGVQGCSDRFVDCSPLDVLRYFKHADGVVTDTFHGTIFSIVAGVPFASILRGGQGGGYGNEEKLSHLLATFGLEGRRAATPDDLAGLLQEPLDLDTVTPRLHAERQRSREYLASQILSVASSG